MSSEKSKGKRMMMHIDPSGDPAAEEKDRVYLMVDKPLLDNFVKDLLYACAKCDADPDTNGFTAILAGQLIDVPDDLEDHINKKVEREMKQRT
ncbi:MAG: hypothetical protein V3V88_02975 [Dehalococcoidia bacterium]